MKADISIVGAGLSGVAAALTLEKAGLSPVIYESSSRAGGRVKTDIVEGYQLDHGFQVLLDAYPKAMEYFDYDELALERLLPGAVLYGNNKERMVGDPSRYFPFLLPTLESGVASLRDLYLMWTLHRELQGKTVENIFEEEEFTTADFLNRRGFSEKLIQNFFRPFFTGIFLEPRLETSSRMFCFVFKMFGSGYAAIPRAGIGTLAEHLAGKLKNTVIHYNTPVKKVQEGKLLLQDGKEVPSEFILVATDSAQLMEGSTKKSITWHSCDTLYFEMDSRTIKKPIIGLVTEPDCLINNLFYHTSIAAKNKGEKELLSVTVVKEHDLDEKALITEVKEELRVLCKIEGARFLKRYQIRKALPRLKTVRGEWRAPDGEEKPRLFYAGDHLMYGSSNAALASGEKAANAIVELLKKT